MYSLNEGADGLPPELSDLVNDIDKQIEFHKHNILNSRPDVVEEVVKQLMLTIVENLEEDVAGGMLPLLTAFGESLIELKSEVEHLKGELIEKKSPPPISFEEN